MIVHFDMIDGDEEITTVEDYDQFPTFEQVLTPAETDFIFEKIKETRASMPERNEKRRAKRRAQFALDDR